VARVYAEALLAAAGGAGQIDGVLEELESFIKDVFPAQPQFETYLNSLAIGRDRKEALLRSALGQKASPVFLQFLLVLNNHDRLDLLRPILAQCRILNDQRLHRVPVHVTSAVPIPPDQRQKLLAELRELMKNEPVLQEKVDPNLIGGLIIRVGDYLYDASVRTQIDTIRTQLIEKASHEIQSRRDRFSSAS